MKKSLFLSALAVTVLFSVVAFATADVANYTGAGTPRTTAGTVNVNAAVNPKITLAVTTPDVGQGVDFGAVDPGTVTGGKAVGLLVASNKTFDVAIAQTDGATFTTQGLALARDLTPSTSNPKGAAVTFTDNYTLTVPWTADPGNYSSSVVYTVTQN